METLPGFGLPAVAANTVPGAWGRDYAKVIEMYDHFAGMWLVGEDLPQAGNGMRLHPTDKDQHGMPVPVVHYKDHANDMAMRNHAYKAGTAVYQSLGAQQVFELPPFPSTHNMGTCRQSEKPSDGVCNKYGQTHDVAILISDGSQFTTSSAENPTLTIVALAIRKLTTWPTSWVRSRRSGVPPRPPAGASRHKSTSRLATSTQFAAASWRTEASAEDRFLALPDRSYGRSGRAATGRGRSNADRTAIVAKGRIPVVDRRAGLAGRAVGGSRAKVGSRTCAERKTASTDNIE